jgi:hypothetical protein
MLVVNDARTERNPAHCAMNSATQHFTRWRRRTSNTRDVEHNDDGGAYASPDDGADGSWPVQSIRERHVRVARYRSVELRPCGVCQRAREQDRVRRRYDLRDHHRNHLLLRVCGDPVALPAELQDDGNPRKRHAELVAAAVNDSLRSPTYGQLDSSQSAPTSPENSPMYSASNSYEHSGANSRDRAHTDRGLGGTPRVHHEYEAPRDYPASSISLYRQGSYVPADPAKVRDILEDADL